MLLIKYINLLFNNNFISSKGTNLFNFIKKNLIINKMLYNISFFLNNKKNLKVIKLNIKDLNITSYVQFYGLVILITALVINLS